LKFKFFNAEGGEVPELTISVSRVL